MGCLLSSSNLFCYHIYLSNRSSFLCLAKVYFMERYKLKKKFIFYFVLGLGYFLISLFSIYYLSHYLQKETQDKLLAYAPSYAITFERNDYSQINFNTDPKDPVYLKLIELEKKWVSSNPAISDIYTLNKSKDGRFHFMVDSETDYDRNGIYEGDREIRTPIGEIYEKELIELNLAFQGKAQFVSHPYKDKWGEWLSAFVPIQSDDGQILGVLGVDYAAADFFSNFNRTIFIAMALLSSIYMIGLKILITNFKNILHSKSLKLALAEAEKLRLAKGRLVAQLSHKIRTPLNGIVAIADLLQDQSINQFETSHSLSILKSCSGQLMELINDILDFSKLDSKK